MKHREFNDVIPGGVEEERAEIRNNHINMGTGEHISITDSAYLIMDIVGFNGELYFNADNPDGTIKKLTDVSKLSALGWEFSVKLESGIRQAYQWYNS